MHVPRDALFQNCINASAPPNRKAVRSPDKKSFKQHASAPVPLTQIQNNFTELFLIIPSKNAQMVTLR